MSDIQRRAQRVRVEQGIYQQPNGKYAVCFMVDGRPRFRTVGYDLDAARIERAAYIDATRWRIVPATPQLPFARSPVGGQSATSAESKPASAASAPSSTIATTSTSTSCRSSARACCGRSPSAMSPS